MIPVEMAHDHRLDLRRLQVEILEQFMLRAVVGVVGVSRLLRFLAETGVDDNGLTPVFWHQHPEEIGQRARPARFAQVQEPGSVAHARALAQGIEVVGRFAQDGSLRVVPLGWGLLKWFPYRECSPSFRLKVEMTNKTVPPHWDRSRPRTGNGLFGYGVNGRN